MPESRGRSRAPRLAVLLALFALPFGWSCTAVEDPAPAVPTEPMVVAGPVPGGRVDWQDWDSRPRNSDQGKPTLLFLTTRRSYWCREMAERCFGDPFLAREVNRITHPVRIDADLRPDLAERYGMGAWPSLAIIFPDGGIVTGTTTIDPVDLESLLRHIDILFSIPERREDLARDRRNLQKRIDARKPPAPVEPSHALLDELVDSTIAAGDRGERLSPESVLFLVEYGLLSDRPEIASSAAAAVDPPIGTHGLVVRAELTRDGVLRDEEQPLSLSARWMGVAARIRRLLNEGPPSSVVNTLAAAVQGLQTTSGLLAAGVAGYAVAADSALVLLPAGGVAPIDTTTITSWNAVAVSALAAAGRSESAGAVFDALLGRRGADSLIVRAAPMDRPFFLEDQAAFGLAALDLGRVSVARRVADAIQLSFRDADTRTDRHPDEGSAHLSAVDYEMPSPAGLAAQLLLRVEMESPTANREYAGAARELLTRHIKPNIHRAARLGSLARALLMSLYPAEWEKLSGPRS